MQRSKRHLFKVKRTEEAIHKVKQTTGKVAVQRYDDLLYWRADKRDRVLWNNRAKTRIKPVIDMFFILIIHNSIWHHSCHLQEPVKQGIELFCVRFQSFRNPPQPALCKRGEAQNAGLQVDHTTTRHCGWRCHCQILHFKHHCHHLCGTQIKRSARAPGKRWFRDKNWKVDLTSESLMISPELRHSFLLSSNTVFMFSIQTASTGPSNMYHFFFLSMDAAPVRIRDERMPSVLKSWEKNHTVSSIELNQNLFCGPILK